MARRHFTNRFLNDKHYTSHHYENSPEGMFESRVEMFILEVFGRLLSIPAAFGRAFSKKKITTGQKKSQKSQGIPNNLFEDQSSFEE